MAEARGSASHSSRDPSGPRYRRTICDTGSTPGSSDPMLAHTVKHRIPHPPVDPHLSEGVPMRSVMTGMGIALLYATTAGSPAAAQTPTSIDGLISSAKAAAGTDWSGIFMRLCIPPAPGSGPGGGGPRSGPPARESWYAEPARAADNLYFLGTRAHHAWALVGSEGIIVIEALFDYAASDQILGGLRKMGLDPDDVRYVVMSHAHGDHDGGARMLQDSLPSARLVYGTEDWDLATSSPNRAGGVPRRDLDGTDGLVLSVGDASLRIVTMPGHTAGTLSYLFEARDNGQPMRIAYVGGTAIPFNSDGEYYDGYLASSQKVADAAAEFGATVLLSNHTEFDNGLWKAHAAANRRGVERNPFDVGAAGVARYFQVVRDCTTAAKMRAAAG